MQATLDQDDILRISNAIFEQLKPVLDILIGKRHEDGHDGYMTVKQLSIFIGMSEQWIYNNMRNLPHFNIKRKPLFKKSEIEEWLERYRVKSEVEATESIATVLDSKKTGCFKHRR